MVIVKASKASEAGVMPGKHLLEAMDKFNEELVEAGVWLDGAGLKASSQGGTHPNEWNRPPSDRRSVCRS